MHESEPQVTCAPPQLPSPVQATSHWPLPQMTVPVLQEPLLPHEIAQSPSVQLIVVP